MSPDSRDASLHGAPHDGSISVSIVADGSHHGANAFGASSPLQHDTHIEQEDKKRSPSCTIEQRHSEGNQTARNGPVSTPPFESAIAWQLRVSVLGLPSDMQVFNKCVEILCDGTQFFMPRRIRQSLPLS